jgi:selenide, water dikinase
MNRAFFPPLTQTVQKGGCAAKIAAKDLREILRNAVLPAAPPELLVGAETFDDAAVFRLTESSALVQTLDFFTPILDSPSLFGQVAAANALSDVYAMGGRPITAMGILAFPSATLPLELASAVLSGAGETLSEAGVPLVGGHSIDDETLKFGLSVTGLVDPRKIWTNAKAKAGHLLILTKPLGTGTLTAALKRKEVKEGDIADAISSMTSINRLDDLLSAAQWDSIAAATDVTGFGLLGHGSHLALASSVDLEIYASRLPAFASAREFLRKGFLTKAHSSNRAYTAELVSVEAKVTEEDFLLMVDPQTSGGLLLVVEAEGVDSLLLSLKKRFLAAAVVGSVRPKESEFPRIRIRN